MITEDYFSVVFLYMLGDAPATLLNALLKECELL
jgi:hypothetical protein